MLPGGDVLPLSTVLTPSSYQLFYQLCYDHQFSNTKDQWKSREGHRCRRLHNVLGEGVWGRGSFLHVCVCVCVSITDPVSAVFV